MKVLGRQSHGNFLSVDLILRGILIAILGCPLSTALVGPTNLDRRASQVAMLRTEQKDVSKFRIREDFSNVDRKYDVVRNIGILWNFGV